MRLNRNLTRLAMLAVVMLGAAGCSGIHQSGSVSPLDFFLPGAGHLLKADSPATNAPVSFPEIPAELASIK